MAETEPMLISEAVQEEEPAIDEPPPEPKEAEEEEEREAEPPAEEAEPPAEEASVEPQEDGMEESGEHFKSKFRETERRTFGRSEATESGEASTEGAPAEDVPAEPEAAAEDERASQVSVTDMQGLENDLKEFRRCIESIGTQLDDEMNRQEMRTLRADIREKATRIENDLKERQKTKDAMEPQERVHLHQVIKQLDTQLNTYHELLERERAMTRRYPLGGVEEDRPMADEAATPRQAQQILKKEALEREREQAELVELERDIVGLQGIQTELATLIGEQEDDVQLIEQHVERAGDRVEHGHSQVVQGVQYSRSNRKIMCVIATVVSVIAAGLIILAVIVLAIVLANRG